MELYASAVKMFEHDSIEAKQGLCQSNVQLCRQVRPSSLENVVRYLDKVEDNVARLGRPWNLIGLSFQHDLFSFPGTPRDVDLQLLLLLGRSLSLALLA